MARTFIFTEEQMKHILGEDFITYLNSSDNGCDFPKDSIEANGSEVSTIGTNGSVEPTLDKIGASLCRNHPFFRKSTYGVMYERNHSLDGKLLSLGKKTKEDIDAMAGGSDKLINNMSKENGATANCLYVRRNRLQKMKETDPERYKRIGGEQIEKSITDTLETATELTKDNVKQINRKNNKI